MSIDQRPSRSHGAGEPNRLLLVAAGLVGTVGLVAAGVTIVLDASVLTQGAALGIGLLGWAFAAQQLNIGAVPDVTVSDPRPRGDPVARRFPLRRRLLTAGGAAAVVLGAGGIGLIRWLGPRRTQGTPWNAGMHLVTATGDRIRADEVPLGGFATVWPEDAAREETAAAILVRLSQQGAEPPTVMEWVVNDTLVAYSKVCTHAGCPVGLFRERDSALFCPCHQATFDAARGAVPTFGPAVKPLPQLPIGVDDEGFLVAVADYDRPVGPVTG